MGVRASHRHSSVTNACIHGRSFARPRRAYGGYGISNVTRMVAMRSDIPVPRTGGTAVPARLSRTSSICSGSAHTDCSERNPNRTDRHDTCDADGSVGTGVVCGHQCDHSGQWQPDAPDGLQHARIQPPPIDFSKCATPWTPLVLWLDMALCLSCAMVHTARPAHTW